MEIADLTIDIAGLAGLFSASMKAIEQAESYKKFELESRYITAQFIADKATVPEMGR